MHHPIQVYRPEWSSVFSDSPERGRPSREWALNHMANTGALVFSLPSPLGIDLITPREMTQLAGPAMRMLQWGPGGVGGLHLYVKLDHASGRARYIYMINTPPWQLAVGL